MCLFTYSVFFLTMSFNAFPHWNKYSDKNSAFALIDVRTRASSHKMCDKSVQSSK